MGSSPSSSPSTASAWRRTGSRRSVPPVPSLAEGAEVRTGPFCEVCGSRLRHRHGLSIDGDDASDCQATGRIERLRPPHLPPVRALAALSRSHRNLPSSFAVMLSHRLLLHAGHSGTFANNGLGGA